MLSQSEVVPYLLERRLVHPESIVEGDIAVADASRRNQNFKVLRERAPSYLLKQGVGDDGRRTVAHEAAVYEHLRTLDGVDRYLPLRHAYDPVEGVLVIELIREGQDLRQYHARGGRFSKTLAGALGRALASVHRLAAEEARRTQEHFSGEWPPWVLSIHRPSLGQLRHLSNANVQLIRTIQRYEQFAAALDELHAAWRRETLIHGDIRWDNCIVFPASAASQRKTRLKIVDWELASWGDAGFDVGSVFADYLSLWIGSIPVTGEAPPQRWAELARFPLERMQPAILAFWRAYVREMHLTPTVARRWLPRAVRYCAARLLQSGFEQARQSIRLDSNVLCFLQVSLNMLMRPAEAGVQLLGIPWEEAA